VVGLEDVIVVAFCKEEGREDGGEGARAEKVIEAPLPTIAPEAPEDERT